LTGRLRNLDRRKNLAFNAGPILFFSDYFGSQVIGSFFCLLAAESGEAFRSLFLPAEGKNGAILAAAGSGRDVRTE
jgi:hypothetical protein